MSTDTSPVPTRTPAWILVVRALLVVATLGAGYLAWVSFHNGPVAGCGLASGCNKVLQSRWAYWLDVPVSVPALAVYLALFGATILLQKRPGPDDQRGSWAAIITLSVIVAGAALWFVGLQVFVIKAFCKFCMTAHTCGLVAAGLCLWHIPWARDPATPMWKAGSGKSGVPASGVATLTLAGLIGVAVLCAGQLLVQKERNVVKVVGGGRAAPAGTDYLAQAAALAAKAPKPVTPNPHLVGPGLLSLYSNQFVLKLAELPVIGSPTATNYLVSLYDYTCPHCRALHPILVEVQKRFGSQLSIVSLPMPISTNCNPYIPAGVVHSVSNACELARLGLAVWRAKPEVHAEYDRRLMDPDQNISLEQAREYASQLVGSNRLQSALSDPWIEQQLLADCRLHYTNWNVCGSPVMPQLILGDAISSGPLLSPEHLMVLLNRYLGLNPAPKPAH